MLIISSLNGQLSTEELKINQRSYWNLPNSVFLGWLSVESQPQNPEFRNNPENFHPYTPVCKPTRASIGQRSYADRDNAPNREAGALNMKGVNKFRTCANTDTWLLEKAGTMVKRFNPWTHFVLVIKRIRYMRNWFFYSIVHIVERTGHVTNIIRLLGQC